MPDIFQFKQANGPLLVSFPHDGTELPAEIEQRCTDIGKQLTDTDWYISQVYAFIDEMDISYIKPHYSRYVVDLNRSPEGGALYPGKFETSVCPTKTFANEEIYLSGKQPDVNEIQERVETYWQPYHQYIKGELERIRALHGFVILWDAHSIYGEIPNLFPGKLPALNFGTAAGSSCDKKITGTLNKIAFQQCKYSFIIDGRFKGGYITRHYGSPENNIHAVQLELNQNTYLRVGTKMPPSIDEQASKELQNLLGVFFESLFELELWNSL